MSKMERVIIDQNLSKIGAKNWRQKSTQKVLKFDMPWGGRKWQKSIILGRGVPGGQFYKFFEILHFFAKTLHFRTPKNDPYKMSIPHK
jgi:hypothetical protein